MTLVELFLLKLNRIPLTISNVLNAYRMGEISWIQQYVSMELLLQSPRYSFPNEECYEEREGLVMGQFAFPFGNAKLSPIATFYLMPSCNLLFKYIFIYNYI